MAGVAAAIDYLAELGAPHGASGPRHMRLTAAMQAIQAYERSLAERLIGGLLTIPGLDFYGIREEKRFSERAPTVAVRLAHERPRKTAERLAELGLFVWDGNYYALNWAERMGLQPEGAVRIGLAHYNTPEEVDRLLEALGKPAAS
jgi:selenocysteine lyase/cysteine desulfurase